MATLGSRWPRLIVSGLVLVLAAPAAWGNEADPEEAAPAAPPAKSAGEAAAQAEPASRLETETADPDPRTGSVSRAVFATSIHEREPVGEVSSLTEDTERIYFFSELIGLEGETVIHRWEHEGEVMAEVPFVVGGSRWRVHSSKRLLPGWDGEWTVTVLDGSGGVLHTGSFVYDPAALTGSSSPRPEDTGLPPASMLD